ncbi:MAG TPA: hypothetical protein VGG48_12320 [Rhizomicrobium sp.]
MSSIGSALRAGILALGLAMVWGGAASACDDCQHQDTSWHDGYNDGHHDGRDGWHDGRDGWHDGRDGYRDGDHHDGYRDGDGWRDGRHDGYHEDGYRDGGCHDGCERHVRCHSGCGGDNYSCVSGRFDCRFEGDYSDNRFRERYYDGRGTWVGGGAYGHYGP